MATLHSLSGSDWFLLLLGALLFGMAKAGISGLGTLAVPIMAAIFGGKVSSGLILPMLMIADLFAVVYYNRHAQWSYIRQLLPAAALGILLGIPVGYYVSDDVFKVLIAIIVFASLGLMMWQEWVGITGKWVGNRFFSYVFGLIGGFSTMIGNAAGPIMNVYLLSTRLSKTHFIGTAAWYFLLVNFIKFPFHVFIWKTITPDSLLINLLTTPAIALGIFLGIRIVAFIPEREFRYFIIIVTFLASVRLLW